MKVRSSLDRTGKERGAATLITAVVLMIAVLGITFYVSETVLTEKRLVSNEYRSKQAFYAAQAGIDYGIAYLKPGNSAAAGGLLDQEVLSAGSSPLVTVSMSDVSLGTDGAVVTVHALGKSDDLSVQRTLIQTFGKVPIMPNPSSVPVISKGIVSFGGNLKVTNTNEKLTIWTGDDITSFGSTSTYIGVEGDSTNLESQLSTSSKTRGSDVVDGDSNLKNATVAEFLHLFFGDNYDTIPEIGAEASLTSFPADPTTASGMIYIDGDASIPANTTYGSVTIPKAEDSDNPVIIVVNGELSMQSNSVVNGIVVAKNIRLAGGAEVNGSIIATEDVDFGGGTMEITHVDVNGVIQNKVFSLAPVNGAWKDWE